MKTFQASVGYSKIHGYAGPFERDDVPVELREQVSEWLRSTDTGPCARFWIRPDTWAAITHEVRDDPDDLTVDPESQQMTITMSVYQRDLPKPPLDLAEWFRRQVPEGAGAGTPKVRTMPLNPKPKPSTEDMDEAVRREVLGLRDLPAVRRGQREAATRRIFERYRGKPCAKGYERQIMMRARKG